MTRRDHRQAMRRLRGRRLHPNSDQGDGYCDADGCSSPPPVLPLAPAPPPSVRASLEPCPPDFAPSPAPVPTASWGRRDQGRVRGYGSPPGGGGGDDHRPRLVTSALIAVAAIAFVSLILLGVSVVVRRLQVRRRRQALLAAPAAAPAAPTDDTEGDGGGGVVHHAWYIRTVGLHEADISSIAATRYRAGAGLLGAADCTVCLSEFQHGELVRLLPKCGHAFHVPCIDTWLRAHVNCPLCRSDVLDRAVTADAGGGESSSTPPAGPVDGSNAAVAEPADATSEAGAEHEHEEGDHPEASPAEEAPQEQSSLPEPPPPQQLSRPLPHNVRRAASMDAATVSTAADVATASLERLPEAAPDGEEQSGRRKRGTGPSCVKTSGSGLGSNLSTDRPAPAGIPKSFFSRHCRARSSVLPL